MSMYGLSDLQLSQVQNPAPFYLNNAALYSAAPAPVAAPAPSAAPAPAAPSAPTAAATAAAAPGGPSFQNIATDAINQIAGAGQTYVQAKAKADVLRNTQPVPEVPESVGAARFTPPKVTIGTGALALG